MNDLLVMKFGGTSMGSAERIRVAARLITEQTSKRSVVVVVSAMSKVTDLLLDSLRKAEAGDQDPEDALLSDKARQHRVFSIAPWQLCPYPHRGLISNTTAG